MAYEIHYGPEKKRRGGGAVFLAMVLVLSFLAVGILWPEGAERLRDFLTPGDPAVTTAALEDFAQELRGGKPVTEALRELARRIKGYGD